MLSFRYLSAILGLISQSSLGQATGSELRSRAAPLNSSWPFQSFETQKFYPPELLVNKTGGSDGRNLFLAPDGPLPGEVAPLIMTVANELVWQGPFGHAFNFGVQTYRGQQVLVYWNGTVFPEPVGRGSGSIHLLDNAYEEIAVVSLAGNFLTANVSETFASNVDLHEIYITENDTILVTANNVTTTDLTSVGGPQTGWVVDSLVYEIDIATNEVLFRWSAMEHVSEIPLTWSVYPLGAEGFNGSTQANPWGYFHVNSVAPYDGGYLISSRYLCSAIAIDGEGNLKWRLQGRTGGDFALGPGTNFCYQHDIRLANASTNTLTLLMHDNANCPIDNGSVPSSGLVLDVDLTSKNVSLNQRFLSTKDPIFSTAQGNLQRLPDDGHTFIGHGWIPKLEEFDAAGNIVMTIQFGAGVGTLSYRAFRSEWIGCPKTPPALLAKATTANKTDIYMSWNGATQYDSWIVYGGATEDNLKIVSVVAKQGFETHAAVEGAAFVQVEAASVGLPAKDGCHNGGTSKSIIYKVD